MVTLPRSSSSRKGFTLIRLLLPNSKRSCERKGFTLIELMIAISVVAILSTIGLMVYSNGQKLARDAKRKSDLRQIQNAVSLFYQDNKRYPCSGISGVNGWARSSQANWLSDSNAGACGPTTAVNLAPGYIDVVPKDPLLNTGTESGTAGGYGYQYWSVDADWGTSPKICRKGQFFYLVAHLENKADPQRLGANAKTVCGTPILPGSYGDDAYIVSQPET